MSGSFSNDSKPVLPAAGVAEELDWDAFSARFFPGRRRHDLEVLSSYAAYKDGREWRKSPPKLTLVPNESLRPQIEADSDEAAEERLLVAVSAVQVWEGEGGFSPS
jgi:hypothetical protein